VGGLLSSRLERQDSTIVLAMRRGQGDSEELARARRASASLLTPRRSPGQRKPPPLIARMRLKAAAGA